MKTWQLQVAKNRLSEVVRTAQLKGPQMITQNGVEAAVVISAREYRRLKAQKTNLVDFFQKSPLFGVAFGISRSDDRNRPIDLR